jgi:methyl-accepting chemotaxis protein
MHALNNLKLGIKMIGSFIINAAIIIIVSGMSYFNIKNINTGMITLYNDRMLPVEQLGTAQAAGLY